MWKTVKTLSNFINITYFIVHSKHRHGGLKQSYQHFPVVIPIKQSSLASWNFGCSFLDAWQSRKMCKPKKNMLHKALTEDIQCFVSSTHSGTRQTLALRKHTQERICLDTAGLLHWKKMHLAANPCMAAQRVSTRPLSLPLLAPAHQHCSSQMDPDYEWAAYFNSDLVYLHCTAAEERFRKQFSDDLHIKSQKSRRMNEACQACSHCCVLR